MKTKVFEPGAICAAAALLVVFSVPAYAKWRSTASHTRVGKTSTNATSVKPVTSSRKTQSGTLPNIQVKSKSKILDRKANRQQIEVNKSEKAAQQVDDQGKSVSDRNKAIKTQLKKPWIRLKRPSEPSDAATAASDVNSVTVLLITSAIGT